MSWANAARMRFIRAVSSVGYRTTPLSAAETNDLSNKPNPDTACLTAVGAENPAADPDLARLIEAWPQLSAEVRKAILRACRPGMSNKAIA